MTKKGMDRMESGTVCTARRRNGEPCLNYAIRGAKVCRLHGGSAPQVRAAAQVRILMASDLAAKKLVDLMQSPTVDDRVKLSAAKDLLDRANLAGTQNVEIGVTKRDFSDVTADVVMDLDMDEEDDPNVVVAEIVPDDEDDDEDEDDHERWEREDAQAERAQEIARMRRASPIPPDPDLSHERAERERPRMRQEPRRVSTADPHADRYPERSGGRRSMSPKRYEQYRNEGGQG